MKCLLFLFTLSSMGWFTYGHHEGQLAVSPEWPAYGEGKDKGQYGILDGEVDDEEHSEADSEVDGEVDGEVDVEVEREVDGEVDGEVHGEVHGEVDGEVHGEVDDEVDDEVDGGENGEENDGEYGEGDGEGDREEIGEGYGEEDGEEDGEGDGEGDREEGGEEGGEGFGGGNDGEHGGQHGEEHGGEYGKQDGEGDHEEADDDDDDEGVMQPKTIIQSKAPKNNAEKKKQEYLQEAIKMFTIEMAAGDTADVIGENQHIAQSDKYLDLGRRSEPHIPYTPGQEFHFTSDELSSSEDLHGAPRTETPLTGEHLMSRLRKKYPQLSFLIF